MRHAPPRWLLLAALALACSAPVDDLDAGGDDAPDAPFNPCGRPCPSGQVCRSLRCVAVTDAGSDAPDVARGDVAEGFDAPSVPCCPIDSFVTCGCVRVGGTMQTGRACRMVCGEGFPEFWRMSTDINRCPVWLSSGLSCRDAGDDDAALDAVESGASGASSDLGLMQ